MKTTLLIGALALLVAANGSAQITLTSSGYSVASIKGTDTLLRTSSFDTAFPSFARATNATWDLSTLVYDSLLYAAYYVNADTSAAQFADSQLFTFDGYYYTANIQSSILSSGYVQTVYDVNPASYSLPTGGTDSLWFDAQHVLYSTPDTLIAFPATYGTSWTSTSKYTVGFHISFTYAGYSHSQGTNPTMLTELDSVIGWGKMRVKTLSDSASGYMNVLQVRSKQVYVDSYYVGGSRPSFLVLSAFGITEPTVNSFYSILFYRAGSVTPLARVSYPDSTYSKPSSVMVDQRELMKPTGVTAVANEGTIVIAPNPVTANRTLSVDLPSSTGAWSFDVINITGNVVTSGKLGANTQHATLQLPSTAPAGIYYIRMYHNGNQMAVKAIDVVK
jgi:hypothetical protein